MARTRHSRHHRRMALSWDSFAGGASAVVALAGVAIGASMAGRSQRSQWTRDARLRACSEFLRGYTRLYQDLGTYCRKGTLVPEETWTDWEQVLAGLTLLTSRPVVGAAVKLDEAIWRAH